VERRLVKVVGRKQVVGRPFLYGTTREFLERFGLNDLADLPKVEDMSELLGFDLPATCAEPSPQTALPFDSDEGRGRGEFTRIRSSKFEYGVRLNKLCRCTASRPGGRPMSSLLRAESS
jgi:hypothetical protein